MKRKQYTSIREVKEAKKRRKEAINNILTALLFNLVIMGCVVLWFIG
jgi:hypothetical protein